MNFKKLKYRSVPLTMFIMLINVLTSVLSYGQNMQDLGRTYLQNIEKAYLNTSILAFDGNIKYYTNVENTSPAEIMTMSYRRDGEKVYIVIGDQIVVYDGVLNIIINEDQKIIYVSSKKPDKKNKMLPTGSFDEYLKNGSYNIKVSDYLGNKKKMAITSSDKSSASSIEFIYQPTTNFIEFSRMVIDREDQDLDDDLNKKKFECSYYNYKTALDEKIDIYKYLSKVKSGKKTIYKGVGKFKDFEIVVI